MKLSYNEFYCLLYINIQIMPIMETDNSKFLKLEPGMPNSFIEL